MKKGAIIAASLLLLLLFIIAVVGGQLLGGLYLLKKLAVGIDTLSPLTLITYYKAYIDMPGVGKLIQQALLVSFAPIILIVALALFAIFHKKGAIETLHGEARFATELEIQQAGMIYDEAKEHKWPPVMLGKIGKRYIADYTQEYTTLSALPGAGKGVSFVIPNLLQYPDSIIVFDPKTENFNITAGYRSSVLKQDVYLFSPDNAALQSHGWNPLDYIREEAIYRLADIKGITSILIPSEAGANQSFFLAAQDGLNGILLYLMETPEEDRNCYRALELNQAPMGFEKWAFTVIGQREHSDAPLSSECKRLLLSYANEDKKKRDTTKSIINTYLSAFDDQLCKAATNKSDFSFYDLRKKRMTIYVGISPTNVEKYSRLLNLFFSQALSVNTSVLPEDGPKGEDGKSVLKYQCMPLLDEFTALGAIGIIRSSSGYTRAYNMRYSIIFQNKAQVFSPQNYGQEGGSALLETFHNEIVFATESVRDSEEYSKRLGYTTLKHRETSRTRAEKTSTTVSVQRHQRALMLPQEIQRLPYEKQLIFKKGGKLMPILCDKIFWYKDEFFLSRANLATPAIPPMVFS